MKRVFPSPSENDFSSAFFSCCFWLFLSLNLYIVARGLRLLLSDSSAWAKSFFAETEPSLARKSSSVKKKSPPHTRRKQLFSPLLARTCQDTKSLRDEPRNEKERKSSGKFEKQKLKGRDMTNSHRDSLTSQLSSRMIRAGGEGDFRPENDTESVLIIPTMTTADRREGEHEANKVFFKEVVGTSAEKLKKGRCQL